MLLHPLAQRGRLAARSFSLAAARSAAAAAAARRAGTRGPSCRAAPPRSGRVRRHRQNARLPEQPEPILVGRASRGGSGCRRRRRCRSAAPAARSGTCSWPAADPGSAGPRGPGSRRTAPSPAPWPRAASGRTGTAAPAADVLMLRTSATARQKSFRNRVDRLVREHPADLLRQHVRIAQLAALGELAAARRPGCSSTGRTTAATRAPDRSSGRPRRVRAERSRSTRSRNFGDDSSASSARSMPASKSRSARPLA